MKDLDEELKKAGKKQKKRCSGYVLETKQGDKVVALKLKCNKGKCKDGKCKKRKTEPDHHGTWIEWCGCSDKAESCNIYIEHKADGSVRFDCFTLGCDDGTECQPVKDGSIEIGGKKITKWVCRCVKSTPPS